MAEHGNVYVDMVGDLFHPGHVALLRAARTFGERLIVGVLSDEVVATYKHKPIMTLAERVAVIDPNVTPCCSRTPAAPWWTSCRWSDAP